MRDTEQNPGWVRRSRAALATVLAGAMLSACAGYAPAPLTPDADAALSGPDLRAVASAAAGLRHPRLAPVEIDCEDEG